MSVVCIGITGLSTSRRLFDEGGGFVEPNYVQFTKVGFHYKIDYDNQECALSGTYSLESSPSCSSRLAKSKPGVKMERERYIASLKTGLRLIKLILGNGEREIRGVGLEF